MQQRETGRRSDVAPSRWRRRPDQLASADATPRLLGRRPDKRRRKPTLSAFGGRYSDLVVRLVEKLEGEEALLRAFFDAAWDEAAERVELHRPWAQLASALQACRASLQTTSRVFRLDDFDAHAVELAAIRGRIHHWSPAEAEHLTTEQHFTMIAMGFAENDTIARALRTSVGAVQKSVQRLAGRHASDPDCADADLFQVSERVLQRSGTDLSTVRQELEPSWDDYERVVRELVLLPTSGRESWYATFRKSRTT